MLNNIVTLKCELKVTQDQTGTIRKRACGFLFALHSNYGRIFNHLWDIHIKEWHDLENWVEVVQGHWNWRRL